MICTLLSFLGYEWRFLFSPQSSGLGTVECEIRWGLGTESGVSWRRRFGI